MNIIEHIHVGSRTYLSPDRVVMIKADISYSLIYMSDGSKMLVSTNLLRLQHRFGKRLQRIHRSFLINPDYLSKVMDYSIQTTTGLSCPMSRRLRKNLILEPTS